MSEETVELTLRVNAEQYAKLETVAKRSGQSIEAVSAVILALIPLPADTDHVE